nr:RNA-directed DNA polymerase, eukaryota, reverse transcriptase zinc-binding domain protein [Tanacetum cinerariifolium]
SYQSKEDEVLKISSPVFVANFPDSFGAKDLWNTCKQYGGNSGDTYNNSRVKGASNSYAYVVKGSQNSKMDLDSSPVMVLDDSYLNEKDYSLCLMCKVKDFATLANLKVVVANEGFDNIKFKYMRGYWVMMEFQTEVTKLKFQENSIMKTWFSQIQLASSDFNTDRRVTWVEIEEDNDEEEDSEVGSYEEVPNGEDVKNVEDLEGDSDGEIVHDTKFEEDFSNQKGEKYSVGQGHFKKSEVPKASGSILQLIDDLVKVGETIGASVGNSGGILYVWDPNMFKKMNSTVSDYFVMVRGDWMPNGKKLLIISVYAPRELSKKKMLWDYLSLVMSKWEGEVVIMNDFNEVRNKSERFGTLFNRHDSWKDAPIIESNALVRMMKKLEYLKEKIRMWNKLNKEKSHKSKRSLLAELADCVAIVDKGKGGNNVVNRRTE